MGGKHSKEVVALTHIPDASISSNVTTPEENQRKDIQYAKLKSAAGEGSTNNRNSREGCVGKNVIEDVYNEDFSTIDHVQAMRFPPIVARQVRDAVRDESERRCAETEKTMARCLQDKMWTSWKCQKERDAYYHCVEDEERRNLQPSATDPDFVDLLTAYRWKFNLGVLHGEIGGRNKLMQSIWKEHFPDRDLPHPWVRGE